MSTGVAKKNIRFMTNVRYAAQRLSSGAAPNLRFCFSQIW